MGDRRLYDTHLKLAGVCVIVLVVVRVAFTMSRNTFLRCSECVHDMRVRVFEYGSNLKKKSGFLFNMKRYKNRIIEYNRKNRIK